MTKTAIFIPDSLDHLATGLVQLFWFNLPFSQNRQFRDNYFVTDALNPSCHQPIASQHLR